jgi:RHS repeat-associated protein
MTQAVVNSYAYDPFGQILGQQETIPQPFKFVGRYGVMAEPNGLYYMRARYYDPGVGRFISEDPLGFRGGDVNLSAYVQNNPVNRIDPWGLLLTDAQVANIIFNETRSLSGPDISQARQDIAHAIINGDTALGTNRPATASTTSNVPQCEQATYNSILSDVAAVRNEIQNSIDPTNGAMNFNFRNTNSTSNFQNLPIQTQVGPLNNSYTGGGLNPTGVYANTYGGNANTQGGNH